MNILVYKQKRRKCQNGILKSIKHGFQHDYFLHSNFHLELEIKNLMNLNNYAND